jgi:hypothetical protein
MRILLIGVIFSVSGFTQDLLEISSIGLIQVDHFQTRRILDKKMSSWRIDQDNLIRTSSYKYEEQNIILGKRPSRLRMAAYFTSVSVLHYLISKKLKQPYREIFQVSTIIIQVFVIHQNTKSR